MKCNQTRPWFELESPCPFPMTITITPRAPPKNYYYIIVFSFFFFFFFDKEENYIHLSRRNTSSSSSSSSSSSIRFDSLNTFEFHSPSITYLWLLFINFLYGIACPRRANECKFLLVGQQIYVYKAIRECRIRIHPYFSRMFCSSCIFCEMESKRPFIHWFLMCCFLVFVQNCTLEHNVISI